MLYTAVALLALWLALALAGDTPCGRALRRALVDWPASRLARITQLQVVLWVAVFGGIGLAQAVLGHEAARGLAMALPEFAGWVTMVEVTAYLDALVALVTTASLARLSGVKAWVRSIRPVRRPRARTPRRRNAGGARRMPANDDDPAPAFALAG